MKYPITSAIVWTMVFMIIGRLSESVMLYGVVVVLGIHLGAAILPERKSIWHGARPMIKKWALGAVKKTEP